MTFFVGDNAKRERRLSPEVLGKECKSLPLPARERVGVRVLDGSRTALTCVRNTR